MQMCQGHCYLSSEELSLVLGETLDSDQVSEQLTTLDKLHEKVNSKLILEDILHVNKEGMLDGIQNIFLALEHFFKINRDAAARAKQIHLKDQYAARFFAHVEHML